MIPIYLVSKTPFEGVVNIPILKSIYFTPNINFNKYDGLIITSKEVLFALKNYNDDWKKIPLIVVGDKTANLALKLNANIIDKANGYGEDVIDLIISKYSNLKWCYLRPKDIANNIKKILAKHNIIIDEKIIYETQCNNLKEIIEDNSILIFTSPKTIECFLKNHPINSTHIIITIGTTTKKALPKGIKSIIPDETSISKCVELAQQIQINNTN